MIRSSAGTIPYSGSTMFLLQIAIVFVIGIIAHIILGVYEHKQDTQSLVGMISLRLALGCSVVVIGCIYAWITGKWDPTANALGLFGLVSICMLMLGFRRSHSRYISLESQQKNRSDAISFALTSILIGLPCLAFSVIEYIVISH